MSTGHSMTQDTLAFVAAALRAAMLLMYIPLNRLSFHPTMPVLSTTPIQNCALTPTAMHSQEEYSAKPALQIALGRTAADMAKLTS